MITLLLTCLLGWCEDCLSDCLVRLGRLGELSILLLWMLLGLFVLGYLFFVLWLLL